MSASALVEPLRRVALFHGLSPMQITEIARQAERLTFKSGDVIVEEGVEGDAAFIIVGGEAERTHGPDMTKGPESIATGSLVGEMAMLVETEYSSTVVAKGPVRALRITRQMMIEHMTADPRIADHLVARISSRLHELTNELRAIDRVLNTEVERAGFVDERGRDAGALHAFAVKADFGDVRPGLDQRH